MQRFARNVFGAALTLGGLVLAGCETDGSRDPGVGPLYGTDWHTTSGSPQPSGGMGGSAQPSTAPSGQFSPGSSGSGGSSGSNWGGSAEPSTGPSY